MKRALLMVMLSLCMTARAADVHETLAEDVNGARTCSSPEQRALDFWAGDWDVKNSAGVRAGTSHIERILNGCVVMENWTSARGGYAGKSFNTFDPDTGRWTQHYVDNGGLSSVLVGEFEGRDLVYRQTSRGADGVEVMTRMTFADVAPGIVRQLIEQSVNGGRSWSVASDLRYAAGSPDCNTVPEARPVEHLVVVNGASVVLTAPDGQQFDWYEGHAGDVSHPLTDHNYQFSYLVRSPGIQYVWVAASNACVTRTAEFEIEVIVPRRIRSVRHP